MLHIYKYLEQTKNVISALTHLIKFLDRANALSIVFNL